MVETTWSPPSTVQVGEPAALGVEICVSENDSKQDRQVTVAVQEIGLALLQPTFQSNPDYPGCFTRGVGIFGDVSLIDALESNDVVDSGSGNPAPAVFNEPGEYTLELSGSGVSGTRTHTLTVEGVPFDPSLVESSCSLTAPDTTTPGDTVTLTATISNGNSDPGDVEVTFSFGSATETVETTVPANGSAEATAEFVPEEPGEFTPSVDHTVL